METINSKDNLAMTSHNTEYNPQAQIIYSLFTWKVCREEILSQVEEGDFTDMYATLFNFMKKAVDDDTIDDTSFRSTFMAHNAFLFESAIGNNWKQALKDLVTSSIRRRLKMNTLLLGHMIDDPSTSINELNEVLDQTKNIAADSRFCEKKIRTMKDFIAAGVDQFQKINSGVQVFNPWGIPVLDDIAPMIGGDLNIIAARPGVGKTIVAHNCILGAQKAVATAYWCAEMSDWMISWRCLSSQSGVDLKKLQSQKLNIAEVSAMQEGVRDLANMENSLYMSTGENRKGDTVEDICRWITRLVKQKGIKVAFLDYLQRIRPTYPKALRRDQIQHMALVLKQCAVDNDITIVALAQLNREAASERPALHHLAECSFIEQEASIVVLADRIEPDQDARKKNYMARRDGATDYQVLTTADLQDKLIVNLVKNRNNPKGISYLDIDMSTLTIGKRSKFYNGAYSQMQNQN